MRLDKYICSCGIGSRKEVKKLIRDKQIKVNNVVVTSDDYNINEHNDLVTYNDEILKFEKNHYYMLNKPAGYVTSTCDESKVVMELIKEFPRFSLVPVGRLDKDTEGLLIITDDGILTHILTSPKKHIPKTYYVEIEKPLLKEDREKLEQGIPIDDIITQPAQIQILTSKSINLTIYEGKYHQVKRMLAYIGNKVNYLKRIKMGPIKLDACLKAGEYRSLTSSEIQDLLNLKN